MVEFSSMDIKKIRSKMRKDTEGILLSIAVFVYWFRAFRVNSVLSFYYF